MNKDVNWYNIGFSFEVIFFVLWRSVLNILCYYKDFVEVLPIGCILRYDTAH